MTQAGTFNTITFSLGGTRHSVPGERRRHDLNHAPDALRCRGVSMHQLVRGPIGAHA